MSKANWIVARFDGRTIVPRSEDDLRYLADRYPPGTELKVQVSQSRSLKHHNLYWGVLRRVIELNGGVPWHNAEALDAAVKAQLGLFAPGIEMMGGGLRFELQSISFSSMDQAAFKAFFEAAMLAIGDCTGIDMFLLVENVKSNINWNPHDEELLRNRDL